MIRIEHNVETNEIIEIPMNEKELAEFQTLQALNEQMLLETAAKATAKAALLQRLGITEDEAKLLLG